MIRPIVFWPDPVLRRACAPVDAPDTVADLIRDMFDTMYDAPGRGLAAPQIGVSARVFVMDAGWKTGTPTPIAMINPEILWRSDDRITGAEGCLSIPGVMADVERFSEIRMRWTDLSGTVHERLLTGFDSVCAQHELDHLDGIVTFDRVAPDARAKLEEVYFA